MKFCAAIDILFASAILAVTSPTSFAFAPTKFSARANHDSTSSLKIVVGDTVEEFEARVDATFEKANPRDPSFEAIVQSSFVGAISNQDLVTTTARLLASKGYHGENTLLATSLCCDELARQLEDDFNGIYGKNFNLGGLAGFPFAGKTGFGAMAAHIPDDGFCLLVYGPHVGVAADGTVGKVERSGIALVDTCCGSAVAASGYVDGIMSGSFSVSTSIQTFLDFQQQGVQELILPHGKRLADAEDRMVELPYALYDSQDVLLTEIVQTLSTSIKRGLTMLGGIQINTGPDTPDYFVPLKFQSVNYRGEVTTDMLEDLVALAGGDLNAGGNETNRQDDKTATEGENGDSAESTTTIDRIQESRETAAAAESEAIPEFHEDSGGDLAMMVSSIVSTSEAETDIIKMSQESDRRIEKTDSNKDKIDNAQKKSNKNGSKEKETKTDTLKNEKSEQKADAIGDSNVIRKHRVDNFVPSTNDKTSEKMVSDMYKTTGKQETKIGENEEDLKESVVEDKIMNPSDIDIPMDGHKNTIGSIEKENPKPDVVKGFGGSLDSDDGVEENGETKPSENSSNSTGKINYPNEVVSEDTNTKQLENESKDATAAKTRENMHVEKIRNSSGELLLDEGHVDEDGNKNFQSRGKEIFQDVVLDSIQVDAANDVDADEVEEKDEGSSKKEGDQPTDGQGRDKAEEVSHRKNNSVIFDTEVAGNDDGAQNIPIDTDNMESRNEINSNKDKVIKEIEEVKIISARDVNFITETSDRCSGKSDDGYFFTKKDDRENKFETETDRTDLHIDEDHLSWLTTPDSISTMDGDEAVEINGDEEEMKDNSEYTSNTEEDYNEDNIYVDDTYLLGEQIALALEKANIDIVGVDDEEYIAPVLADALLYNIDRDAYGRMNEGWNQFGAESLYSIGEAEKDYFEDAFELDNRLFTEDLFKRISIATATSVDDYHPDSSRYNSEEILLVAESLFNIMNGDVDKYSEKPEEKIKTDTTVLDIDADEESSDEDDEPPTFHRYVLSVDRTG
eukprot:CAMPEP_0116153668 /NCGR_PEP_ID=MMETSP0329-20121206/21368_1 /TAXON_ID=697910 /ORGANISM="Pseudo-nitzschia arenysensis, Strain B593" /LENGTH=1020 /DNA_ID=CAMNT_0003650593 /DNA_START=110 /DNA_END=3172 /DNA_ORIENTATION=-